MSRQRKASAIPDDDTQQQLAEAQADDRHDAELARADRFYNYADGYGDGGGFDD